MCVYKCARSLLCGLSPFKCLQTFTLNAISKFITETTDQFWWAHLIIVFRCLVFNYGYLHLLSGCNGSSAFAHRIGNSYMHIWWGDTRNIHTIIASLRKKKYKGKKKSNLVQMPNMQPHIVSNHSREKKTLNVIALYNRHSCVPQKEKKNNKNTQHIHHQTIQSEHVYELKKKHPNNWHHNIIAGHRQTNQVESWLQSSMTQHLTQKPSTKTQINQSLSEFGL